MELKNPEPRIKIFSLKNIDYWYWCRYYIETQRKCCYRCSYCNTQNPLATDGLYNSRGLPERKETIGFGLLNEPLDKRSIFLTAEIIKTLFEHGYGINILTKSEVDKTVEELVLNNLTPFAESDRIRVTVTIITLKRELHALLEEGTPKPEKRLETISKLANAGIPTGVAITPIIPGLNDDIDEIEEIIQKVYKNGAKWVLFSGLASDCHSLKHFFETGPGKKVTEIFSDREKVEKRYVEIKRKLLKSVIEKGLSIRIPRIIFNPNEPFHENYRVSEVLFNLSYVHELHGNWFKMGMFRRAGAIIENLTKPIKRLIHEGNLGYYRGINPDIENIIREIVYTGDSKLYSYYLKNITLSPGLIGTNNR